MGRSASPKRRPRAGGPRLLLALAAACLIGPAGAETGCLGHFANGAAPTFPNPKLSARTRLLCYDGYAVLHSGVTRTALWSAEHLTAERIQAARALERVNTFHPDPNLAEDERAELADYAGSGFDRGHMAPSGDMADPRAMEQSFSLANMVPQNPDLNRGLWEDVESAVRGLAARRGEVYVVTGAVFQGEAVQSLRGRVLVPSHVYKAVYDPGRGGAAAYLAPNVDGAGLQVMPLAALEQLAGVAPFPNLPQAARETAIELPDPRRHRRERGPAHEAQGPFPEILPHAPWRADDFVRGTIEAIERFGRP